MKQSNGELYNKIFMITGANSGIGKATALELAKKGGNIVMVCRNQHRGETAKALIQKKSKNRNVDLLIGNLADLKSVRQLVTEFKNKYSKLHVLINNAGVFEFSRKITVDGFEKTFAINHLGHFLLTNLLLDVIKASSPARIINVSSEAAARAKISFNDLMGEKKYSSFSAYGQSKLANILFTYKLARNLKSTGVTVNAVHPGVVKSNLGHKNSPFYYKLFSTVSRPFLIDTTKGADTSVYLASSPEVNGITGKYFIKRKEVRSSKISYDESVQKKLWEISEQLANCYQ